MIGKLSDTDADAAVEATEAYIYDGNQIVLRFADDDAAALTLSDLKNRYLWGPAVDQLLAEENVAWYYAPGTVDWALSDHQHTVRDWVRSSGGSATLADHAQYDAFGNRLDAPAVDSLFGYTGRYHDADTGLQWNGAQVRPGHSATGRWYDAVVGRWLSEDNAGLRPDVNLYRYVGNGSTIYVDPTGLQTASAGTIALPASVAYQVGLMLDQAAKCGPEAYDKALKAAILLVATLTGQHLTEQQILHAEGRGLDDILSDDKIFDRYMKRKFPNDEPFCKEDAQKLWDKLKERLGRIGKEPRLDQGHPGTQWPGPHINVPGGPHIPVVPEFVPS
ncbi:MAG: RHS repeat-associated core domain-containing protein [Pirellulales bacterium]|nr:RHS repeat-associated core domain-containing protein [Pirellulales bacterium]